ncbi:MAG TPA: hypothetical protein VE058_10640 [Steroidobacteraceae bacterium]|nr:hypothetical protein [Steroidobacteraceae bacterium]
MAARILSIVASAALLALSNLAQANCSPTLTEHFSSVQRIVDSVRPDKPGQMRVIAGDGSVFTGAEAHWMKAQLLLAQKECARGDEPAADTALRGISDFLSAHHAP